ncbi:phosphate transport system permease protein PstA [Desulfomarina profundi]|uniref:Phosphate transport system permease protein PstA n=1 Tax=Desulfomarina profundi TaxID=2772557 RepID=A0A8D5FFZ8_9BACT|nr:phosphate ABC transporter permease PstA [Desulfomarina profundi]BCL59860.1 phosphate transport system permease protein PstA [Desulfomarina profundi]
MNKKKKKDTGIIAEDNFSIIRQGLSRRYRRERNFRLLGLWAVTITIVFVLFLFISIFSKGYTAFKQTRIAVDVRFDHGFFKDENLARADYPGVIKYSLRKMFPQVKTRRERRTLYHLVSPAAPYLLHQMVHDNPKLIGTMKTVWILADDDVDMLIKSGLPENQGDVETVLKNPRINERQLKWLLRLRKDNRIKMEFNTTFLTGGDSREPELAGILGAIKGSFYTLLITLALSFPIGTATAIYLEEYAPQNRWTDFIEVNINNLAAVPSIIFGLLGLAIFINFWGLPRSTPLVGGLVLTLMTLPTIIIAGRASLKSVPPSIREAALGVGASKLQTITHHVLPLALPGMLTGTIIGMAQALGETAPLLMIGMVAFIVDIPSSFTDAATVLPVQIYLWADSPERAFTEKTSAAIMILLIFLISMNALAVYLRKKFEITW